MYENIKLSARKFKSANVCKETLENIKVSFVIFGRKSCKRTIIPKYNTTEQGKTTEQQSDRNERPKTLICFSFLGFMFKQTKS